MYDNIGLANQRAFPRLELLKGAHPDSAVGMRRSLPVAAGLVILSGELLQPKPASNQYGYEWVKAGGASPDEDALPLYYWAADDSNDPDVVSAGILPALSSTGNYEFETAFFDHDDGADPVAAPVVYGDENCYITPSTVRAGRVTAAAAGDVGSVHILGEVTGGLLDVGGVVPGPSPAFSGVQAAAKNSNVKPWLLVAGSMVANPGRLVLRARSLNIPPAGA